MIFKSTIYGFTGTTALLAIYFFVVSLISGWPFALDQFGRFWYFIVSLAVGFGIQVGLYVYLKNAMRHQGGSGKVPQRQSEARYRARQNNNPPPIERADSKTSGVKNIFVWGLVLVLIVSLIAWLF